MQSTGEIFSAFSEGQLVADRYRVVRKLGAGSMGLVLQAIDLELDNEPVALKLLFPHLVTDRTVFARFRNEVVLARRLSHPNIVRLYDFGTAGGGYYYISMEFVSGYSLKERIYGRRFDALTVEEATRILFEIGQGMSEAHRNKIVHRDLKPDNILISERGEIKVTDFGLARQTAVDKGFTQSGETVGTPCYMAPEQIRGENVDCRADIYSLGIMAYEMVTCQKPFDDDNWMTLATMHLKEPMPDFPAELNIPSWFQEFVYKSTAKDPADRFQSATEWCEALQSQIDRHSGMNTAASKVYTPAVLSQYVQKAAKGREVQRRRRKKLKSLAVLAACGVALATLPLLLIRSVPQFQYVALRSVHAIETTFGGDLAGLRSTFGLALPLNTQSLEQALSQGDLRSFSALLSAGVDPSAPFTDGTPPIHKAVEVENSEALEALLTAGADPNARDLKNRTPLMKAALSKETALIDTLASHLAQPDAIDSNGMSPILFAAKAGNDATVKKLLDMRASANVSDTAGTPALVYALRSGNINASRLLITAGADPKSVDTSGETALMIAAASGNRELTELLLQRGADPTARNTRGRTARDLAIGEARKVLAASENARTVQTPSQVGSTAPALSTAQLLKPTRVRQSGETEAEYAVAREIRLTRVRGTFRNVGDEPAQEVSVTATLPTGRFVKLTGPTTLAPNQTARFEFTPSPDDDIVPRRAEIPLTVSCKNCRRE